MHGRACANAADRSYKITHFHNWKRNWRPVLVGHLDVPLEVNVEKFKNEVQFLIRVHDVQQP